MRSERKHRPELDGFLGMKRGFITKYNGEQQDSSKHARDMILFKNAWPIMRGTDQKGAKRVEEGEKSFKFSSLNQARTDDDLVQHGSCGWQAEKVGFRIYFEESTTR